jgi:methylated-DNA-protein-cysteine methyltransferase-like protein
MQQRKKTTRKFTKQDELPNKKELSFYDKVYIVVSEIPKGKVTSYGAIAKKLGMRSSARLVGHAMGAVPEELEIPAHRVINSAGALSGAHKFGGYERMRWLLEREGVTFKGERVDMKKHLWIP